MTTSSGSSGCTSAPHRGGPSSEHAHETSAHHRNVAVGSASALVDDGYRFASRCGNAVRVRRMGQLSARPYHSQNGGCVVVTAESAPHRCYSDLSIPKRLDALSTGKVQIGLTPT